MGYVCFLLFTILLVHSVGCCFSPTLIFSEGLSVHSAVQVVEIPWMSEAALCGPKCERVVTNTKGTGGQRPMHFWSDLKRPEVGDALRPDSVRRQGLCS